MSRHGRSRKEQNLDRKDKHEEYTERVDSKAKRWMEHDAYKTWDKKSVPRYDVVGYMKSRGHDVKGVMSDGRD